MNLIDFVSEEDAEKRIEVQERIDDLSRIERAMLHLWVEGYTQAEIAHMFGYTERHIRRILANISEKCPINGKNWRVNYRDKN